MRSERWAAERRAEIRGIFVEIWPNGHYAYRAQPRIAS